MALTWTELTVKLADPFPTSAIYWRAGTVSRDKKRAQALPYAEPRVYEDRLNALCPGLWSVSFKPWGDNRIICELTLGALASEGTLTWSTRASTGEENEGFAPGTAAEAQAFKRACSKFGLGRYLYDVPIAWVAYDENTRRLLETPALPDRFLPKTVAEGPRSEVKLPPTLSTKRADAMHREMEKLGLARADQHRLAETVLGHEVTHFTELTEAEALEVWNVARRARGGSAAPARRGAGL